MGARLSGFLKEGVLYVGTEPQGCPERTVDSSLCVIFEGVSKSFRTESITK
jgi:hypothetical protein